jgi:SAM-dependent methyltransferase
MLPFLRYPLQPFRALLTRLPEGSRTKLTKHLQTADYSFRMLRYWWAGQALKAESERLGRPLCVVDVGCERGWLKHFTSEGAVERWIGLDWNPQPEVTDLAKYDEVHHANFDDRLPLAGGIADVVVSLHVFEHLPRPGATMGEISRLLKPDGLFLGGAPTMPQWLATLRERHFRKRWQQGKLASGGHITVLSPARWNSLAVDAGMEVEFITGSHAIRCTGSQLENFRWWVRLNQMWGGLFPSLGSECYMAARRSAPNMAVSDRLEPHDPHRRGLWVSLGATAAALALAALCWLPIHLDHHEDLTVAAWMDAHQTGADIFLLRDDDLDSLCGTRKDLHCADTLPDLLEMADKHPNAHVLVSVETAHQLVHAPGPQVWRIDSRLDMRGTDFLLLKRTAQGTTLGEYLLGTAQLGYIR